MPYVKNFMNRSYISVSPDVSALEAVKVMDEKNIGSVLVMEGNKLVGILTERDVLRKIASKAKDPSKVKVSEVMSSNVITIGPETTISDAANIMVNKGIRRLPVIENNRVVGVITMRDLTRVFIETLASKAQ